VRELLAGYQGVLQTDGYAGYDEMGCQPFVVHVGCWAHARRRFDEAPNSLPAKERTASGSFAPRRR
jgi:transposase